MQVYVEILTNSIYICSNKHFLNLFNEHYIFDYKYVICVFVIMSRVYHRISVDLWNFISNSPLDF